MRNGGWAMRAKECLSCDRFMPPIANYLPFGNPAFRMWPLGPSCFDGIRTRTGQFLGLSPLPVGPRKHAQAIRKDMPAQSTVDSTTRAKSCTHACGGRAYCNTRHDRDHGAEPPCSTEAVPTACGSADKKRGRPRSRKPFPHWADRLYRIRANPSDGGLVRIIHP